MHFSMPRRKKHDWNITELNLQKLMIYDDDDDDGDDDGVYVCIFV